MTSQEREQLTKTASAQVFSKTAMEKFAFLGRLNPLAAARSIGAGRLLKGLGMGAGLAGAGYLGYRQGRADYQPTQLAIADPGSGAMLGEIIGPHDYVEDIADAAARFNESGDAEELDRLLSGAGDNNVVFKGAEQLKKEAEIRGRYKAHAFFNELRKCAHVCAQELAKVGVGDDDLVKTASAGNSGDLEKIAELFILAGVVNGQAQLAVYENQRQAQEEAGGLDATMATLGDYLGT